MTDSLESFFFLKCFGFRQRQMKRLLQAATESMCDQSDLFCFSVFHRNKSEQKIAGCTQRIPRSQQQQNYSREISFVKSVANLEELKEYGDD